MGELSPYSRQTISVSQSVIDISKEGFYDALRTFGVVEKKDAAWFNKKNGGFYVTQKGHQYHKEEIEAAKILAQNGYQVIMQPEGDGSGGISLKLSRDGQKTYPEGKIGALWYEQHSITGNGGQNAVYRGLMHAHEKGTDAAVIFDKSLTLNDITIRKGINHYKRQPTRTSKTMFNKIYVITKKRGQKKWQVVEYEL